MADEIFNTNYTYPGQSVPTPDAPIVSGFDALPVDNSPPDAPIVSVAAGNGTIDPAADGACAWRMNRDAASQWGPMIDAQFQQQGSMGDNPLAQLNRWSLDVFNVPFFLPSFAVKFHTGRGWLMSAAAATLAFSMPVTGKKRGAKWGWGLAGFFFPVLTTGAVAFRQVTK